MSNAKDIRVAVTAMLQADRPIRTIMEDLKISRSTVMRVKRRVLDGKDPKGSPRKRRASVLTPRVVGGFKKRIKAAPTKSLRRVAKEANVSRESVRRVVRGAGWKSLRKVKVPLISAKGR